MDEEVSEHVRSLRPQRPVRSSALRMADVAEIAGVSTQTVSRALNNAGRISAETRERVLKVVEELGYRPNNAARTLVNRRSGLVGIIVSDTDEYAPRLTMLGIEAALRADGFGVSLISYDHGMRGQARAAMRQSAAQGVEAVILIGATPLDISDREREDLGIPIVSVRADLDDSPYSVGIDHIAGAVLATEHLLSRGHSTVMHVGGPPDWLDARLREDGWRKALGRAGAVVPDVRWRGDWTARSGYDIGRSMIASGEAAAMTAVFVANDQMAMGLSRALIEAGFSVPEDVSIVGYDDLPEAGYYTPPLTTVRQDLQRLGAEAARLAVRLIVRDRPATGNLIAPTLVTDGRVSGG